MVFVFVYVFVFVFAFIFGFVFIEEGATCFPRIQTLLVDVGLSITRYCPPPASGQSLSFRFHLETANFPLSITSGISHFSSLKNVDRTIRPGPLEDVIGYN